MRHRVFIFLFIFFAAACSDDADGPSTSQDTAQDSGAQLADVSEDTGSAERDSVQAFEEHLTAQIDGMDFAAQLVAGTMSEGLLQFQSDQSQERQLFFTLPADIQPGIYTLAPDSGYFAEFRSFGMGTFPVESGTLTVTSLDLEQNQISGTFEFVGVMDDFGTLTRVNITEGLFAVEFAAF